MAVLDCFALIPLLLAAATSGRAHSWSSSVWLALWPSALRVDRRQTHSRHHCTAGHIDLAQTV